MAIFDSESFVHEHIIACLKQGTDVNLNRAVTVLHVSVLQVVQGTTRGHNISWDK